MPLQRAPLHPGIAGRSSNYGNLNQLAKTVLSQSCRGKISSRLSNRAFSQLSFELIANLEVRSKLILSSTSFAKLLAGSLSFLILNYSTAICIF